MMTNNNTMMIKHLKSTNKGLENLFFLALELFRWFHRKDRDIPKLQLLLFSMMLFAGIPYAQAQCVTGCNSNYGLNSNNDAASIEYDNIISGNNNTIIKESDGTFKVFGYGMASDGFSNVLSPLIINSTNFPGLQGTVLKAAIGGNQAVVLTTQGLYAWGNTGSMLSTTVKSTASMGPVTIAGSNTYGLPQGVEPGNVKSLFGTSDTLALLTCNGEAWVLTQTASVAGVGLSTANHTWNRVTTAESGNPTLNNVAALRGGPNNLIALLGDGTLWTWGSYTYLGDGTAYATRNRATKMTLPNPAGVIKMIGMTSFIGSYYVLYTDGNLYAMGDNANRQLGDWTTATRTSWIQPKYTSASGAAMNNIRWISPSEHYDSYQAINVLTTTGQVYNWGTNYQGKLRSTGISSAPNVGIDPGSPNTDRMLAIESGANFTIVIKACTQNFGFAGNQYYGNAGDGSNTVNATRVPYYYTTAPVNVCGANAITTAGTPVFNTGLPTNRCQGAGTVTYTATSSGGSVSYSLTPAAAGTIDSATGAVTYNASWSGTAVITATDNGGCGTPGTATFTVTVAPAPATPVFNSSLSTQRCTGADTVTYTATSTNADSITYTITNTGTGTQPTINPATGEVTYAANWIGTSTITAIASGCSTTASSTFTVSTAAIQAVADAATGPSATPLVINVLTNDLCSPDPTTLTIATQPANGSVQIGAGGIVTYLPNGDFAGTDTFVYRVCTGPSGACSQATVTVTIEANLTDVCSTAGLPKTFYLPFPENAELKKALMSAGSDAVSNNTTNARRIIGIRANYSNTLIYYDHWEDGYEPTAGTRTQTTTEIWGDGNTSNGVAPGYPTDIFPEGAIITLDNNNPYRTGDGRTPTETTIQYDGRDKIYSTKLLTLTKVTGSDATFAVQNTKGNVIDTNKFGRLFVVPFGENISSLLNPNIATTVFDYTSLFVRASENGTIVQLDYNGDGVVDVTSPTLAEGMVWFYEGTAGPPPGNKTRDTNKSNDIKSGAVITSNKPVGVDLVFGGIDNYGTRNIPLLPGNFYGSTYYSPVYTTLTTAPVYAVFTNSLNEDITVNWKNGLGGNGSIIIPAKGYTSLEMNQATAYKFESANGKSYTAVTIVDADANGLAYDWAFNMIPGEQLTNFTTTAWAPGMASAGAANPVWITPTKSTTVYVKYTGSVISTAPGSTSPCGLKYDAAYTLSELQAQKVFTSTGNGGMSFFTCDGTPISAVYGQDSSVAAVSGATTLDAGFTLDPQCVDFVIFANDDQSQTYPNIPVTIDILNNDVGRVSPTTVTIVSQPTNGTVVVNPDGTVTYTPNPGFSGTDTFNYQVCNSDRSLCSTAVVTVNVGCLDAEMKHILTGKIFDDANKNGANDNGEGGIAHTVNLYLDANGNGVLDTSENTPVESVTTTNTGAYVFDRATPTPTTQASHDFATASYSAGTGWSTNWIEEGETTSATAGNIQIVTGELRITGNTAVAIRRSVSAPVTNALLSFDYRTANLDGLPYKTLLVEVAPSATGPWTTLGSLYSTTGYTNGKKVYNIPASVVTAGTTIRFRTTGAGNHFFYIDNVAIQSIPTVNYIVQLAEPLPANSYQTLPVSPQKGYAVAFSGYKTSCSNNFGLATCSAAGTTPAVNTSVMANCSSGTVNLNTQAHTGAIPSGSTLLWFTDATHTTAVVDPTAVGPGTYYAFYYSSGGNCYSAPSQPVNVTVDTTTITAQPDSTPQNICVNGTATQLSVTANNAISYQWYYSNAATGGSVTTVTGATSFTYTPPTVAAFATRYYFVIVTGTCGSVTSSPRTPVTVNAYPTSVSISPTTQTVTLNSTPTNLTATATGATTYQWYSNTNNSNTGGTLIIGATSSTYTPPTNALGTLYYYVVASSGSGCGTTSATVQVNVTAACTVGSIAPAVSSPLFTSCPSGVANLNNAHTGTIPANASLVWFRDTAHTDPVSNPTAVGAGVYYAFYYSTAGNCYSPASSPVNVIAAVCSTCTAPADPQPRDLNSVFNVNAAPSGSVIQWHTSATPSSTSLLSNTNISVTSTPTEYWVYYYNTSTNCYSPGSKLITVTNICCNIPTVNLNTTQYAAPPDGSTLVWYSTRNHLNGTLVNNSAAVGEGVYWPYFFNASTNTYTMAGAPVLVAIDDLCACYKPGATTGGTVLDTKVGISALGRAGTNDADNWPMTRKGGHIALESKTKAFVPNRVAFSDADNDPFTPDVPVGIAPANFVEGMMVYDTTNKCMKLYTTMDNGLSYAWYCISTPTCPD
ncbi:hypothetical protein BXY58_0736 [Epilithonimonas arachidiradicis]|uniref:Gliding motility-associated-like protein n=2 Tax=Epilithonimonas arachidiradicis TaxID=1617282 RepID=A0A420DED3_9FLAO|nr:hypothetical protein BXY58_0736 [Epilithonimonas arachidiradicis]